MAGGAGAVEELLLVATSLHDLYRRTLLDDVMPFWLRHSLDARDGGYFNCLDRDGSVFDTDKYGWMQAREVWTFARLYNTVERRPEWLEAARAGVGFLLEHGFTRDGRMHYRLTRDGRPVHRPWGIFTECFGVMALAQWARAAGDDGALKRAMRLFDTILALLEKPRAMAVHAYGVRPMESHAIPMMLLVTGQELREHPRAEEVIGDSIQRILFKHLHPEERAVFENVAPDGSLHDSCEGRCLNPGHALESAWFVMEELRHRGFRPQDSHLLERALLMVDVSMERGWDREHGGILYFVDAKGRPLEQLEWDMKLWWVHCEALYATLLACRASGDERYWTMFGQVHDWTFQHFPDPEFGEWFGYLNRRGEVALRLKGSMWKCCFHLPRALLHCMRLLEELQR